MSEQSKKFRRKRKLKLFVSQKGQCAYCQVPHPIQDLTFDHVTRKRDGGRFTKENIVLACWVCNQMREPGRDMREVVKQYRAAVISRGVIP